MELLIMLVILFMTLIVVTYKSNMLASFSFYTVVMVLGIFIMAESTTFNGTLILESGSNVAFLMMAIMFFNGIVGMIYSFYVDRS